METRWHQAVDMQDWLAQALARVGRAEAEALARQGAFHIVLAGGETPRLLYQALARETHAWDAWHVWLGDERCLPAHHPERNSHMIQNTLLQFAAMPPERFHPIPAELGPKLAAERYAKSVAGVALFDLVLLGLGEDGHTASLFPGHDWGASIDAPAVLPVHAAPKPPAERVSLSARRLAQARQVLFLVTGPSKRDAIARWLAGEALPASAIRPSGGVDVLLTRDALPFGVSP
jgi:6-phosphogluconolactonase